MCAHHLLFGKKFMSKEIEKWMWLRDLAYLRNSFPFCSIMSAPWMSRGCSGSPDSTALTAFIAHRSRSLLQNRMVECYTITMHPGVARHTDHITSTLAALLERSNNVLAMFTSMFYLIDSIPNVGITTFLTLHIIFVRPNFWFFINLPERIFLRTKV